MKPLRMRVLHRSALSSALVVAALVALSFGASPAFAQKGGKTPAPTSEAEPEIEIDPSAETKPAAAGGDEIDM